MTCPVYLVPLTQDFAWMRCFVRLDVFVVVCFLFWSGVFWCLLFRRLTRLVTSALLIMSVSTLLSLSKLLPASMVGLCIPHCSKRATLGLASLTFWELRTLVPHLLTPKPESHLPWSWPPSLTSSASALPLSPSLFEYGVFFSVYFYFWVFLERTLEENSLNCAILNSYLIFFIKHRMIVNFFFIIV